MKECKVFAKGQVILLSSGSFSDYDVDGVGLVLRAFTSVDVMVLARQEKAGSDIIAVLVKAGWIKEVDWRELKEADWSAAW